MRVSPIPCHVIIGFQVQTLLETQTDSMHLCGYISHLIFMKIVFNFFVFSLYLTHYINGHNSWCAKWLFAIFFQQRWPPILSHLSLLLSVHFFVYRSMKWTTVSRQTKPERLQQAGLWWWGRHIKYKCMIILGIFANGHQILMRVAYDTMFNVQRL